ncbi:MAG TPA: hypothetical protein ENI86_14150 [Acidimicrobiales bacterium]|nr:hypothetical protein [Acidimicrobiales bacterium]
MIARISVAFVLLVALLAGTAGRAGAAGTGEFPEPLSPVPPPAPGTVGTVDGSVRAISDNGNLVLWEQDAESALFRLPVITDRSAGTTVAIADAGISALDMSGTGRYVLTADSAPVGGGYFEAVLERRDRNTGSKREVLRSGEWINGSKVKDASITSDGRYVGLRIEEAGGPVPRGVVIRVVASSGQRATVDAGDVGGDIDGFALADEGRYGVLSVQKSDGTHVLRHDFNSGAEDTVAVLTPNRGRPPLAISPDGRFVVVGGTIHDVVTGSAVAFVSEITNTNVEKPVAVSADGNRVVFLTDQALTDVDDNSVVDAYAWTRSDGTHRRISVSDRGTELTNATRSVVMTPDGARVGFQAWAPNAAMNLAVSGISGLVMVADLADQIRDIGVADVARPSGGGLLTAYRSGEVTGAGGAPTYDDCNADSPISGKRKRPMLDSGEVVTSISPTPAGDGYWLFTNRGRVLDCGSAEHFGDLSAITLAGEVIDSVATPTGRGYYMVGADGGVFAFGDAVYRGSVPEVLPGVTLNAPIVAITVTGSNQGYRMVAADGGMFNFGDARYFGSVPEVLPGVPLAGPVIDMVASDTGYLIVADDGGIFNFGVSPFHGSLGATSIPERIRTVLVVDDLSGYVMFDRDGRSYPFGTGDTLLG